MTHLISPQVPHAAHEIREHTPVIYSVPSTATIPPKPEDNSSPGKSTLDYPSPSLDSLPVEIISCIAQHVRALSQDVDDHMPRVPRVCPCLPVTSLRRAHAQVKSRGYYQEATLALSMTCTKLREIIFEAQLGRRVSIGLCDVAATETRGISEGLRSHVRYVSLMAWTFTSLVKSANLPSYDLTEFYTFNSIPRTRYPRSSFNSSVISVSFPQSLRSNSTGNS